MRERPPKPGYWFPAKRFGWGWGPPVAWQGWAVLLVFFVLLAACVFRFLFRNEVTSFLIATFLLTLALMGICWLKGERPSWRWGDE